VKVSIKEEPNVDTATESLRSGAFDYLYKPIGKERTSVDDLSGTETVLIVEDNANLRKFERIVLKQMGYKILEAGNGEEFSM